MGNTPGTRSSTKLQDIHNYSLQQDIYDTSWIEAVEKSFIFVWCDAAIGTTNNLNDDKNTIIQIAQVVNKNRQLIHTFNEINACRDFITNVNHVCLIISGSMGQELVPSIHNLEQIHSIYIFCFDKPKHEVWASHYRKIRGVFTDIRTICESLKSYIISQTSIDYDRIEFDVINKKITLPTIHKQELVLIYSKLSQIILCNMNSSDHGKHDMINYCRNEYTSEYQVQLINDFDKNYTAYNPVWWYTRNCFFQGIINRALRTYDLYTLCSMSRFIKDLDMKLKQLYESQRTSNESFNLYFGQFLSKDDFDKITKNLGELMCINEFLTANPEQGIAMMFLKQQNSTASNKNKIRVLFQIHIDRTIQSNASYANIGVISQFVHEKEYLISMSSIYRINKIEQITDIPSAYLVQLTLIGRNDLQYNDITQNIQKEQLEKDLNLSVLGYTILDKLHQFKSTNKLFKQVLFKNRPAFRSIVLHYNMAVIYDAMHQYEKALDEYRCALTIAREYIPTCYQKDDLCLISLYSNMGLAYQHDKKFTHAFEHAFRALSIISNVEINSIFKKELLSSCYYNLGLIHEQENKFHDARNFYEHALRVRQEYLPLGHSDVTILQRCVTLVSAK